MLTDDIRHAFHAWRRTPVLSATVILTVALGVGANTAVFSVVHAVIFRPLPYPAAERLVELFEQDQRGPFWRVSPPNYLSWTERSTSFDAIASFRDDAFNLTDDRNPERVSGARVTASLFRVLSLAPVRGRPLRVEDERPAAPRVALIAESLWRRRFGGDEGIVGQSITLNGERHQVIGVVPPAFREVGRTQISASVGAEIFVPLEIDPLRENRSNHVLRVVGRLRPGVSLDRAREEMRLVGTALEQEYPASNTAWGIRLERIQDSMFDTSVRPSLLVLLGAVGIVLLTACANIANLLLARASGRQRELVMRTILGAERPRLVKQLMTESLCLALVGGVCGLVAASVGVGMLRTLLPATLPRIDEVRVDAVVLTFGVIVSLISGVLFGALPAIHATRIPPLLALVQGGRGIATASRAGVRRVLLVTQMGLATMLLVAGALLLQSFMRLQHVPLGFEPGGVITARVGLPRNSPERVLAFYEQLVASLQAVPQLHVASIGTSAPFGTGVRRSLTVRDYAHRASADGVSAVEHIVSADYFRALAIPVIAGSSFTSVHSLTSPPVAIVSQSLARQLWPTDNPVGQQIERDGRPHQVIGVVGDVRGADGRGARGGGVDREPGAAVYLSPNQFPQNTMTVVVRAGGSPSAVVPAIRATLLSIDATLPLYQVRTLEESLAESTAQPQLTTTLTAVFAVLALLLASVGIYGVVSYSVERRTAEMGLRMAVGATPGQVLRLMLRGGMAWATTGIAVGLVAALMLSQGLASLLFEVQAQDPITFGGVGILLALVALIACYVPARHGSRIDPLVALRYD